MGEFCMPSLGADMETGTLVEWLVAPGSVVKKGDVLAVVETQKGLFEIEAFEDGILGPPMVEAGAEVPVGTVLAVIASTWEEAVEAIVPAETVQPPQAVAMDLPPPAMEIAEKVSPFVADRQAISPSARHLAMELGVDLTQVRGTGPNGVIQRRDIERVVEESGAAAGTMGGAPSHPPGSGMRQAIAAAMSRSNREIPHYYVETEIDMTRSLDWLAGENAQRSLRERVLPAALLLKAMAMALHDVPELNGFWQQGCLEVAADIHIGFAIAIRQGGLVVPAIHHVDQKNLHQLMLAIGDLIERSRSGRLRGSEMTDATITMTSLGDRGVKTVFGVIYPPQVALVAFGRIMERPWVDDRHIVARRCLTATLSGDHRATDGHKGALFLEALNRHLQRPEAL
ncbi:MAG: dihydrolipoamide acetyltransferase family protein [Desulfobulbus sp.]|nr:dihydrolipoamide acetyltransferase family protein [Desulfobulbus sp.]